MNKLNELVKELVAIYNEEQDNDVVYFASEELAEQHDLTSDELDMLVAEAFKAIDAQ